jgi:ABC-type branched-subunit amino acid transport system ATPase component
VGAEPRHHPIRRPQGRRRHSRERCAMTIALETQALEKQFGGLRVTRDLSLRIEQGARHALIGPNGAGKTTVINLLTGVLRPNGGRILLEGNDITDLPVHKRVLRGLSRTFQINQLYADLTPLETIGLAVSERLGRGGDWWRRMGTRDDVNAEIAETLSRFHLLDVMNDPTATLPYGKQRLLEIALAIAAKPRVLLLDEPAAGVPESERHDILAAVAALPRDVTVLLIEHDMDLVFSFADRISVLVSGALLVEGAPDEVARDPQVKAVYLGEAADA